MQGLRQANFIRKDLLYLITRKVSPALRGSFLKTFWELISTNSFVLRALVCSQGGGKGGQGFGSLIFRNVFSEASPP